jgi:hypothetical protein
MIPAYRRKPAIPSMLNVGQRSLCANKEAPRRRGAESRAQAGPSVDQGRRGGRHIVNFIRPDGVPKARAQPAPRLRKDGREIGAARHCAGGAGFSTTLQRCSFPLFLTASSPPSWLFGNTAVSILPPVSFLISSQASAMR